MQKLLLSIDEVAAALGVGRRTAYTLRTDDPAFPRPVPLAARVVKYRAADVLAYVERLTSRAPTVEPDQLKTGRDAYIQAGRPGWKPGKRGQRGGLQSPLPAAPSAARGLADRSAIEPAAGVVE